MATDEFSLITKHFGSLFGNILMRGSVKSVTPDFVLFILIKRNGIQKSLFLHTLMKGRIKSRHLFDFRQQFGNGINSVQKRSAVQRQQIAGLTGLCQNIFVNNHRLVKILAAVPHPMSYGVNLFHALNRPGEQHVQNFFNRLDMIMQLNVLNQLFILVNRHADA